MVFVQRVQDFGASAETETLEKGSRLAMIHFFLMVNKHGQTRLADYFGPK